MSALIYSPTSALVVFSLQIVMSKILYAVHVSPTHAIPFPTHHIARCVGDMFVSLVQVRAKKKLLAMPSVQKKPPTGNSSKAGYSHYADR
jgi:hypothetical protein